MRLRFRSGRLSMQRFSTLCLNVSWATPLYLVTPGMGVVCSVLVLVLVLVTRLVNRLLRF